jgi:hypothetical protein
VTARYLAGELVDVTLHSVPVTRGGEQALTVQTPGGGELPLRLTGADDVRVTRQVPADGTPRPGDVWRGPDGELFFALTVGSRIGLTRAVAGNRPYERWLEVHQHPAMGPIELEWRAGVEDSPAGRDTESSAEGPAVATTSQPGDDRDAVATGLRQLAHWLQTHPDVPLSPVRSHVWYPENATGATTETALAELLRLGAALGVEPTSRSRHVHLDVSFAGGVEFAAVVCDAAQLLRDKAAGVPTDIARGGGEVAGPEATGPATAPQPESEG